MDPTFILKVQAGAFVGVLVWFAICRAASKTALANKPRRLAGTAIVFALLGAYFVQSGFPTSPFSDDSLRSEERLAWMLMVLLPATLLSWRHALLPIAVVLPLVLINATGDWALDADLLTPRVLLPLGALGLVACGDLIFRQRPGKESAFQLGLWSALCAAAIGATGSGSLAIWAGCIGIAFGLSTLYAWRKWNAGLLDGGTVALATNAFLLLATTYSELPPLDAVLLAAALPISLLAEHFAEKPRTKTAIAWLALMLPIVIVFVRIALAWESDPYSDYY